MNARTWKFVAVAGVVSLAAWAAEDVPSWATPSMLHQQQEQPDWGEAGQEPKDQTEWDEVQVDDTEEVDVSFEERDRLDRGLYGLLGVGGESYTGDLGDRLGLNAAAAVNIGVRSRWIGLEAGYNAGGLQGETDLGDGFDLVRHSGQLAATVGFTPTPLQPFVLGGIGYETYDARNGGAGSGLSDATNAYIPAGAGVRWNLGRLLTLDARFTYNFLLGEDFGPSGSSGDRMQGLVSVGGTL